MPFVNRCIFLPTAGGTSTWTVSTAVQGYLTPAQAGAADATTYHYSAETRDGGGIVTAWEVGTGTYTVAGTTLTRTVILSSNAHALVNFTTAPQVMICVLKEDLNPFPVPVIITDTSDTTSLTTGALRVSGGAHIDKRLQAGPDTGFGSAVYHIISSGLDTSTISLFLHKFRDSVNAIRYQVADVGGLTTDTAGGFWRGWTLGGPPFSDPVGGGTINALFSTYYEYDTLTAPATRNIVFDSGNLSATSYHTFRWRNNAVDLAYLGPTGNFATLGYARIGSLATPAGTTAGYLTAVRLSLSDGDVSSSLIRALGNLTGGATQYGMYADPIVQSDVTATVSVYATAPATQATAFTLAVLNHFDAVQGTIGAGSAITEQNGYTVEANLTGATSNLGFRGKIPAGSNRWNLYMDGTARNYLEGGLSLGTFAGTDPGVGMLSTDSASFILRSTTTITGGGTGNVPTLTAGPANGNPTKWLPYDDNGTTRYIPSW